MKKILLTILLLSSLVFSQEIWILLGSYDNFTYEASAYSDKKTALTKNKVIQGELRGWYVIKKWELNCKERMVRNTEARTYDSEGTLNSEDYIIGAWWKVEKNSFADKALEVWCE